MRAAAYARYSTDKQTGNSIAYQLNAIQQYCKAENIPIIATYTDEACSGTNADRAGFQAMVAAAKSGLIDTVVIYDITRGSRDVGDWFTFRKAMMYLGVNVISATGQKLGDLTNGQDFLLELITVGMGQVEVLGNRQKSLAGVATKAQQGAFLGGIAPLGYDIVNGEYVINHTEADAVKKIFAWYANGKSYNYMIDHLNGATGKRGRPLGKNSFRSILTNERYIGVYTWNKRKYKLFRKWVGGELNPDVVRLEGVIPPIIDTDTWGRVQKRLKDNKHKARNKSKHNYLLSGLIVCDNCGAAYVGHTSTNKKGYSTRYYTCGNKYRTRECNAKNINAEEIETFVVQNLKAYLLSLDFDEMADYICDKINNASPDLSAEKQELVQLDTKIKNGINAILSGMQIPELDKELDRLRNRKHELEDIIAQREAELPQISREAVIELLKNSVEEWNEENLPQIIRTHIQKIYAHSDGSCTVHVGVHTNGCGDAQSLVCTIWTKAA